MIEWVICGRNAAGCWECHIAGFWNSLPRKVRVLNVCLQYQYCFSVAPVFASRDTIRHRCANPVAAWNVPIHPSGSILALLASTMVNVCHTAGAPQVPSACVNERRSASSVSSCECPILPPRGFHRVGRREKGGKIALCGILKTIESEAGPSVLSNGPIWTAPRLIFASEGVGNNVGGPKRQIRNITMGSVTHRDPS